MQILSVNVGVRQSLRIGRRVGATGIFKQPVSGPLRVTALGLEGDTIVSTKHHGGPDQAVYLYGTPDYAWWEEKLDQKLAPGTFGENLTVEGLESAAIGVGDRFHIGEVVLEATAPRIPCMTLESRMGIRGFAQRFREAERAGVYCRVLQEGSVRADDHVRLERAAGDALTLLEVFRDFYEPDLTEAAVRRILAAPVAIRCRKHKEDQLKELLTGTGSQ